MSDNCSVRFSTFRLYVASDSEETRDFLPFDCEDN